MTLSTVVILVLLAVAATLVVSHYGPKLWARFAATEPKAAAAVKDAAGTVESAFRKAESVAAHEADVILHHNEHHLVAAKAVVSEGAQIVGDVEHTALTKLQELLASKDAMIASQTQRADQAEAALAGANANHAAFLSQIGAVVGAPTAPNSPVAVPNGSDQSDA